MRGKMRSRLLTAMRRNAPEPVRRLVASVRSNRCHDSVDLGALRRMTPISRSWGNDRGTPIDRYYIEKFLYQHRDDVRGHVLEMGDATYTKRFGGSGVRHIDVLHSKWDNPAATI